MRPYISIDIETTGIDPRSEILQISGVIDDGFELREFDFPIKHKRIEYSEPYALGMNAELLKKMMDKGYKTYAPHEACLGLIKIMKEVSNKYQDKNGKPAKVLFAGKNVASFDIPKIRTFIEKYTPPEILDQFNELCHYKTLDVGSLYFDVFGDNVSLSDINKLTGRKEVSHNALDDAYDVVYAIRHKLGDKK